MNENKLTTTQMKYKIAVNVHSDLLIKGNSQYMYAHEEYFQ